MTLVFTLAAIERFADPAAVFEEAREWSRHVGIVDNDTDAVDARDGMRISDEQELAEGDVIKVVSTAN